MDKYEVRYGTSGAYFYDLEEGVSLTFEEVLEILNQYERNRG